ncbi:MAG: Glutamate N-acetyltransferase, partial [Myxococcaceae bacterium]|nr:Glutamate N-acetyltransferase [Myxococcaceae bacterium]
PRRMSERAHEIRGFRFAGLAAGIKKTGLPDLGLVFAEKPVVCAAVFTENMVQAAPVKVARERVAAGRVQAALVNSGNANACTGAPGMAATLSTSQAVASALGIDAALVVPGSTGVIGQLLPADKIIAAASALVDKLSSTGSGDFAQSIMTTDKSQKTSFRKLSIGGVEVSMLGVAKGAGMIHPRMATTLAFVFTDAAVTPTALQQALKRATDESFNIATVDGETSTNDMILVMASGAAGHSELSEGSLEMAELEQALRQVLRELAEQIVADGEGAEHVADVQVRGTANDADARSIARRIATSLLVKTAMHGKDANWGRILSAAGMAGVTFDPDVVSISIDDVYIVRGGLGLGASAEAEAQKLMRGPRYAIRVQVGPGAGSASYLTCDIGHRYIDVNAGYRS